MQSHPNQQRKSTSTIPPPTTSHAQDLENIGPYSTLSCQIQATNVWRKDLKSLYSRASERFPDVCWSTRERARDSEEIESDADADAGIHGTEPNHASLRSGAITPTSFRSDFNSLDQEQLIWAHKAILYARAPNTFQTRFLNLKTPAANLGNLLANSSAVSLPSVRSSAPSPDLTISSKQSLNSRRNFNLRGSAPPSSFKTNPASALNFLTSDSEGEGNTSPNPASRGVKSGLKRNSSRSSVGSKTSQTISRPFSRNLNGNGNGSSDVNEATSNNPTLASNRPPSIISNSSNSNSSSMSRTDSDNYSIGASSMLSTTSTIKAPLSLKGVNPTFFESTLEYLYTGEESMVETFEFLYDDNFKLDKENKGGIEEKLEKLRQDFTFMWRSRLFSDVKIVLGDLEDGMDNDGNGTRIGQVKNIPDSNESVYSLPLDQESVLGDEKSDEESEETSFSAHKMILVSRCPYFASQFLSPFSDSNSKVIHLPSPPFTPAALHFTLGFIYTGTLFFSNRSFDLSTSFQIWKCSNYLQIDTLQSLISSLISNDFCHGFNCPEASNSKGKESISPCKKCIKRVPRVLSFCSSPEVSDSHLLNSSRNTISGNHFGSYWTKEIGNLDYSTRGSLVSQVIKRVEERPELSIETLKQLNFIFKRIEVERSSKWVDALRWMSESVEAHLREIIEKNFERISISEEFKNLIDGIGFNNDVLEKILLILIDGLNDKNGAKIYETLVGKVILREDQEEILGDAKSLIEEARLSIVRFLKRKWISVRSSAGFNGLENWCLKELSHELDVPVEDLLLPQDEGKQKIQVLSKTGLKSVVSSNGRATSTSVRGGAAPIRGRVSSASSSNRNLNIDGEREAGPIHMRASVLNRNAARHSVANGFRLGTTTSSSSNSPTSSPSSTSNFNSSRQRQLSNASSRSTRTSSIRSASQSNDGNVSDEESEIRNPRSITTTNISSSIMSRRRGSLISTSSNSASSSAANSQSKAPSRSNRTQSTSSLRSVASSASTSSVRRGSTNQNTTTPTRSTTKPLSRTVIGSSSSSSNKSSAAGKASSATATSSSSSSASSSKISTGQSSMTKDGSGDKTPTASLLSIRDTAESPTPSSPSNMNSNSTPSTTRTPTRPAPGNKTPTQSLRSTRSTTSLKSSGVNSTPKANSSNQSTIKATTSKNFLKATPKPETTRKPVSSRPSLLEVVKPPRQTPTSSSSSSSSLTNEKKLEIRKSGSTSDIKSIYAQQSRSKKQKIPSLPSSPNLKEKKLRDEDTEMDLVKQETSPSLVDGENSELEKREDRMDLDHSSRTGVGSVSQETGDQQVDLDGLGNDHEEQKSGIQEGLNKTPTEVTREKDLVLKEIQSLNPNSNPNPILSSAASTSTSTSTSTSKSTSNPVSISHQSLGGTRLSLGIPCIVAPKISSKGKSPRFRAVVKYVGPLYRRSGFWVGVEIPEVSLSSEKLETNPKDGSETMFNDGSLDGIRYFNLGENLNDQAEESSQQGPDLKGISRNQNMLDSFRKPEREARKRRIARMIGNTSSVFNPAYTSKTTSSTSTSTSPSALDQNQPSFNPSNGNPNSHMKSQSPSHSQSPHWLEEESSLLPSAKKRKDSKGLGLSTLKRSNENGNQDEKERGEIVTKGLFLRPDEILWVVSGNE